LSARIYAGLKVFRMMLGGWPGIDDSEREAIFFIADIPVTPRLYLPTRKKSPIA